MDNTSGCGTVGFWYTRCKSPWKRASEQEIEAVTNYLTTHQEEQSVGLFKDVRYKGDTIYTVYMQGDKLIELLYDGEPTGRCGTVGSAGLTPTRVRNRRFCGSDPYKGAEP